MLKSAGIFALFFGLALSASTYEAFRALRDSTPDNEDKGKCTTIHPTFTAGFSQTISASFAGKNYDFINYGIIYSDSPNERKMMAKMNTMDSTSGKHMKMMLYQLGDDMYLAMPQLNKCFKQPIPGPSTFTEMMEGAKFMGLQRYGGSGDSIIGEKWSVHWQDKQVKMNIAAIFSSESCTLISAVGQIRFPGGFMQHSVEYNDVKRSVDDPNVFTLPEYCNNAQEFL